MLLRRLRVERTNCAPAFGVRLLAAAVERPASAAGGSRATNASAAASSPGAVKSRPTNSTAEHHAPTSTSTPARSRPGASGCPPRSRLLSFLTARAFFVIRPSASWNAQTTAPANGPQNRCRLRRTRHDYGRKGRKPPCAPSCGWAES
jgi:hypothetical protein